MPITVANPFSIVFVILWLLVKRKRAFTSSGRNHLSVIAPKLCKIDDFRFLLSPYALTGEEGRQYLRARQSPLCGPQPFLASTIFSIT